MSLFPKRFDYKLTHLLFVLSLLTASFDILLNLEVNEVSIRFSLVMQIFFIFSAIIAVGLSKKSSGSLFIWPLAFNYLLIWAIFLVLWTPRTYHLTFSIGYSVWFLICVAVVFAAVQYYVHDRKQALQISRIYINVYIAVAAFGLLQFALGILGIELLIRQWWIAGRLPRLNGFSYEPSYYATYLITGWGMLAWLVERRVYLYTKNYKDERSLNLAFRKVRSHLRSISEEHFAEQETFAEHFRGTLCEAETFAEHFRGTVF